VRRALFGAIVFTLVVSALPFGGGIGWPLALLGTLAHECGHAIVAALAGAHDVSVQVFANTSGVTRHRGGDDAWDGFVSAGGLLGPPVGAAVLFVCGRFARLSRAALALSAAALVVFVTTWASGVLTIALALGWAAVFAAGAVKLARETVSMAVVFLALQLALDSWHGSGYLFTSEARTGAGVMPSDVANMASAFGGVWLVWGLAIAALSTLAVVLGVWFFARGIGGSPPLRAQEGA
jgi:hypothetical protein